MKEKHVSLLRGINVGGKHKILMADLKALFESLGFENVATYIQSGNVVFHAEHLWTAVLSKMIEDKIRSHFNYNVPVITFTKNEFNKIVENNPFFEVHKEELKFLAACLLFDNPYLEEIGKLEEKKRDLEDFFVSGKEIYLYYPNGFARTKVTNGAIEKILMTNATTRNWRTMMKLNEMLE